MNRKSLDSHL